MLTCDAKDADNGGDVDLLPVVGHAVVANALACSVVELHVGDDEVDETEEVDGVVIGTVVGNAVVVNDDVDAVVTGMLVTGKAVVNVLLSSVGVLSVRDVVI